MSEPREVYESIVERVPVGVDADLLAVLQMHVGKDQRISRRAMIERVFGVKVAEGENLSNNSYDRQIRESIERLRGQHLILSSSGDGGYWMPGSLDEVTEFTAEIVSRARKMEDYARHMERMAVEMFGSQIGFGF